MNKESCPHEVICDKLQKENEQLEKFIKEEMKYYTILKNQLDIMMVSTNIFERKCKIKLDNLKE